MRLLEGFSSIGTLVYLAAENRLGGAPARKEEASGLGSLLNNMDWSAWVVRGQRIEDHSFLTPGGCHGSAIPVMGYFISNYTTRFLKCRKY